MQNIVISTHLFYYLAVSSTATSTTVTALSTTVTAPISSSAVTSGMFTIDIASCYLNILIHNISLDKLSPCFNFLSSLTIKL